MCWGEVRRGLGAVGGLPRVLVVLCWLPLAGCSGGPVMGVDRVGADAGTGHVLRPKLSWAVCSSECTYLQVPLDYNRPDGKIIRLAVLPPRASDPGKSDRITVIIRRPGQSGQPRSLASSRCREQAVGSAFDIVGFDPRRCGARANR